MAARQKTFPFLATRKTFLEAFAAALVSLLAALFRPLTRLLAVIVQMTRVAMDVALFGARVSALESNVARIGTNRLVPFISAMDANSVAAIRKDAFLREKAFGVRRILLAFQQSLVATAQLSLHQSGALSARLVTNFLTLMSVLAHDSSARLTAFQPIRRLATVKLARVLAVGQSLFFWNSAVDFIGGNVTGRFFLN